jgi:hypothetical protein
VTVGKDIVFFIGNTGAGKTTTILYLAGKVSGHPILHCSLHLIYFKVIKEEIKTAKCETEEIDYFVLCCADAMPGFVIGTYFLYTQSLSLPLPISFHSHYS